MMLLWLACTFSPGQAGFTSIDAASLELAFEPGAARDLGDGAFLTDQSWAVTPSLFTLALGSVSLQSLQGAEGVDFDPADPPEGYTLCHGGHCHSESGALISYAEVEAELSGGVASFVDLARWELDQTGDLLAGTTWTLEDPIPSADLPLGWMRQLSLSEPVLVLEASAQPHPDGGEPLSLRVDLPLGQALTGVIDLEITRSSPPGLHIAMSQILDGTLLDSLDLESLASDGVIEIQTAEDPGAQTLIDGVLTQAPTFTSEPSP